MASLITGGGDAPNGSTVSQGTDAFPARPVYSAPMEESGTIGLLTGPELTRVREAAVTTGLVESNRRALLFDGLPAEYLPKLPEHASPADQLRSDLARLNRAGPLPGMTEVPLSLWLRNAAGE